MSIEIKNLTKVFGKQRAVDNVSFTVEEGEIVGFLGPNGAGKSTTMKIATCYLPPTSGEVSVSGFDVISDPMEVRRRIGYLPEHNPLYLDMYLHEYLSFMGRIYGIGGKILKSRLAEIIEMCGLGREQNKVLGSLSKGYRQRVGLAQSLIHDPEVLILDEPTTGLDPNQIVEIRNLIKGISKNKTVIFSTHIMQEVQAMCDRVIVINEGKIVADDKIDELLKGKGLVIRAEFEDAVPEEVFESLEGVISVETDKNVVFFSVKEDIRKNLLKMVSENELPLIGLTLQESNIEGIFRDLTIEKKND